MGPMRVFSDGRRILVGRRSRTAAADMIDVGYVFGCSHFFAWSAWPHPTPCGGVSQVTQLWRSAARHRNRAVDIIQLDFFAFGSDTRQLAASRL
jgi:hypothetical protein